MHENDLSEKLSWLEWWKARLLELCGALRALRSPRFHELQQNAVC